jgi:hypothetical protein
MITLIQDIYQEFINLSDIEPRLKQKFNEFFENYTVRSSVGNTISSSYVEVITSLYDAIAYNLTEFWARVILGIIYGDLKVDAFPTIGWAASDGERAVSITDHNSFFPSSIENGKYHTLLSLEEFLDHCTDSWEYDIFIDIIQFVVPNEPSGISVIYYRGDLEGINYGYRALVAATEVYKYGNGLISPQLAHPANPYSNYFDTVRRYLNEAFTEIGRNLP